MKLTRIFTLANGESSYEELDIALEHQGYIEFLSEKFKVKNLNFRKIAPVEDFANFKVSCEKQFMVLLKGGIEIEFSDGKSKLFHEGEVLLLEDQYGKGHRAKNIEHMVNSSLVIELADNI